MPTPTPNDLTRHQLDELDQLLQRMLKLPLATPSNEPLPKPPPISQPDLPPGWRLDSPAIPRSTMASEPASRPVHAAVELTSVEATSASSRLSMEPPSWGPDPLSRYQPLQEPVDVPREPLRLFGHPAIGSDIPPSTGSSPATPRTGTVRGVDAPATPMGFKSQLNEIAALPIPELSPSISSVEPAPVALASIPEPKMPLWLLPLAGVNAMIEGLLKLLGPIGLLLINPSGKNILAFLGVVLLLGAALWSGQGLGFWKLPIPR